MVLHVAVFTHCVTVSTSLLPLPQCLGLVFKDPQHYAKILSHHLVFNNFIYKDWNQSDKQFIAFKWFLVLYRFAEDHVTKWATPPAVDPPVSHLNNSVTIHIEDTL